MTYECIKPSCKTRYASEELEAYYCPSCKEANKILAKEMDNKFVPRPKSKTMLELYDEAPKFHGFPSAKEFMV